MTQYLEPEQTYFVYAVEEEDMQQPALPFAAATSFSEARRQAYREALKLDETPPASPKAMGFKSTLQGEWSAAIGDTTFVIRQQGARA